MNEQLMFLYQEIQNLKQKSQTQKLLADDRIYLDLIERTLQFIKGNLLRQVAAEVANNNMTAIREYRSYLDSEVQKYASRMMLLIDVKENQNYTQKIDKRIKKCKTQLDNASQERDRFNKGYSDLSDAIAPEPIGKSLERIFASPIAGSNILATTRFGSNTNDFLKRDNATGEIKLNRANVLLFLEVFGEHKSDNLRRLVQVKELEQRGNASSEDIQMQLEEVRSSIPEYLRQANVDVFDRFCHYSSLPRFSTLDAEKITDDICYGNEEIIEPALKRLKIALTLDSVDSFSRQDLISMIGEENVVEHQESMQEQISELTSRSL